MTTPTDRTGPDDRPLVEGKMRRSDVTAFIRAAGLDPGLTLAVRVDASGVYAECVRLGEDGHPEADGRGDVRVRRYIKVVDDA